MKSFPRCTATNRDGSPCARRCKDGLQPATCHIHRAAQAGGAGLTQPLPFDPLAKLRKIAASDAHPNQLAAIKYLLERGGCEVCRQRDRAESSNDALIAALLPDERERISAALVQLNEAKAAVYLRRPDLLDAPPAPAPQIIPEIIPEDAPAAPPVRVRAPEPEPEPAPIERDWSQAGLFPIIEGGPLTHSDGDDYANAVLEGRIPWDVAVAAHEERMQRSRKMAHSLASGRSTDSPR